MSEISDRITRLLIKHLQEGLNNDERDELEQWMHAAPEHERLAATFMDEDAKRKIMQDVFSKQDVWARLQHQMNLPEDTAETVVRSIFRNVWLRYAAAIVGVVVLGWMAQQLFVSKTDKHVLATIESFDIKPGRNGAVLTLADGKQMVLDSMGNGVIASQQGAELLLNNGILSYATGAAAQEGANAGQVAYNTMSTPKGRQFEMVLPDGSRVWLNAASTIRYPTTFQNGERLVAITGEAYFEVAKNSRLPFRVRTNKGMIEVLGTGFNVNAYDNEQSLLTTLIEGSVKVQETILQPGQQMQLSADGKNSIKAVNTEQVLAWKNGMFNFEDAGLEVVMRQLERWYDIEVVFENGVPDIVFGGEMSKDMPLSGLLIALKKAKVNCRMEAGRRLIVMP